MRARDEFDRGFSETDLPDQTGGVCLHAEYTSFFEEILMINTTECCFLLTTL